MALEASGPDDRQLVDGARKGIEEARDRLARRHRRSAYLLALQLLGDPDDALDVAQDAMMRLFQSLDRFDSARPVRPWLCAIVRNRVRDLRRRRRTRRAEPLEGGGRDLSRLIVDDASDPARDAERSELRARLWREISALTDRQREIVVLRDFHDLSYAEIAAVLRIPVGTVMSRLHGARRALRRRLREPRPADRKGARGSAEGGDR